MNREHLTAALDGIDKEYMEVICGGNRARLLQEAIKKVNGISNDKLDVITPPPELLFNAFKICKFNDLKCVIIGQDPYPKKGDAVGMSFSAPKESGIPVSLKKIYECLIETGEIEEMPTHPDLTSWAQQGVLLLNMTLTTQIGVSKAHAAFWKNYTGNMVRELSKAAADSGKRLIWMLWGGDAKSLSGAINLGDKNAIIMEWGHPSPLNTANKTDNPANFKYCDHFNRTNVELAKNNMKTINWAIAN